MTERGERHWQPGWVDRISACKRWLDIFPLGTFHNAGDLNCWCKPGIEIVARPSNAQPIIMVKHTLPPHSWVGGDLKEEAIDHTIVTDDEYEDFIETNKLNPDAMLCEVCGCIETDDNTNEGCMGPIFQSLTYTGDTETETEEPE